MPLLKKLFPVRGKKYNCDNLTIEKGEYLVKPLYDWRTKTDCIKDIFHEIMQDERADHTKPAVEWYKNDEEMFCMVRKNHKK
jgi:DNA-binding cell septation regulator SpoVG